MIVYVDIRCCLMLIKPNLIRISRMYRLKRHFFPPCKRMCTQKHTENSNRKQTINYYNKNSPKTSPSSSANFLIFFSSSILFSWRFFRASFLQRNVIFLIKPFEWDNIDLFYYNGLCAVAAVVVLFFLYILLFKWLFLLLLRLLHFHTNGLHK